MQRKKTTLPKSDTPMMLKPGYKEGDPVVFVAKHTHPLGNFEGVYKYKSVWRAIRRKKVSMMGRIYPNRPFNNGKRTKGRKLQVDAEAIYNELRRRYGN